MPPKAAEPDEPVLPYPVETLKHWYVTVCGGMSPELALDQIGINRKALERNTSLDPLEDRVRVAVLGGLRRPFLLERFFEVVPLDERRPEAAALSPRGEAVFPEGDDVLRPKESPRPGDEVVLNGVASLRLHAGADPMWIAKILEEFLGKSRNS